jgi:hypothetical protein
MHSVGTPMLWGGFAVIVLIMLAIDLFLQGRRGEHGMTMKQAAVWSLVWLPSLCSSAPLLVVSGLHRGPGSGRSSGARLPHRLSD